MVHTLQFTLSIPNAAMSSAETFRPPIDDSADKRAQLRHAALEYHEHPVPGKIAIQPAKQLVNQHDLALAYSPGVAIPCEEIVKDPAAPSATPHAVTWWAW